MPCFKQMPSVLIQNPAVAETYLIPADAFSQFKMTPDRLSLVDDGVVTFTIPDDEFVEVTPPFNSTHSPNPWVMVQFLATRESFLLSPADLRAYSVDQPNDYGGYGISFAIPSGNEMIEDLTPVMYAKLQSGEGGTKGGGGGRGGRGGGRWAAPTLIDDLGS